MKNVVVTVIVGFITGLVISGILFDVIKYVGKSFNRVQIAWTISKAEKAYSSERFSDSINIYNKVISKIDISNKVLLAKTKNNLALCIIKKVENEENISIFDKTNNVSNINIIENQEIQNALQLLKEANQLYIEINNKDLSEQTSKNINVLENLLFNKSVDNQKNF